MDKYGIIYLCTSEICNSYFRACHIHVKVFMDTINQRKGDQYEIYYYWEKH